MEQKWISVKDGLPKSGENPDWVLVITTENGMFFYHVAQLWDDSWATDSEILHFITHWMPLPEPPQIIKD